MRIHRACERQPTSETAAAPCSAVLRTAALDCIPMRPEIASAPATLVCGACANARDCCDRPT
eukprot:scaffold3676_cov152-Pinguiococcus_pyrenoidosus.AAC.2